MVIFSFNKEDETIEFRHYLITVVPHGASKSVKKLLGKHLPNLGHYEDISDYIQKYEAAACTRCLLEDGDSRARVLRAHTHSGQGITESDAEDLANDAKVILPDAYRGRANAVNQQSAVRLKEIGPRMQLQLAKVEVGLCAGEIIYTNTGEIDLDAPAKRVRPVRKSKATGTTDDDDDDEDADDDDEDAEDDDEAAADRKLKAKKQQQQKKKKKDVEATKKSRKSDELERRKQAVERAAEKKRKLQHLLPDGVPASRLAAVLKNKRPKKAKPAEQDGEKEQQQQQQQGGKASAKDRGGKRKRDERGGSGGAPAKRRRMRQ